MHEKSSQIPQYEFKQQRCWFPYGKEHRVVLLYIMNYERAFKQEEIEFCDIPPRLDHKWNTYRH